MNEEFLDQQMMAVAAATALSVGDPVGCESAVTNLRPVEEYGTDYNVDADTAMFTGSGVAN